VLLAVEEVGSKRDIRWTVWTDSTRAPAVTCRRAAGPPLDETGGDAWAAGTKRSGAVARAAAPRVR